VISFGYFFLISAIPDIRNLLDLQSPFLDELELAPLSDDLSDEETWSSLPGGSVLSDVIAGIHRPEARAFWRHVLQASPYILRWIDEGYPLTFDKGVPSRSRLPNNGSAKLKENLAFVTQALCELEEAGAIEKVQKRPHTVLPLQVAWSKGKRRIIVDASRQLNDYLPDGKVRLDHLFKIAPLIPEGAWLTTLDLKSGYYHLKIHENHKDFLGIEWQGQFYRWRVAFLGLRPLVRDFTSLLKPVMAHLATLGITAYVYIDDFLIVSTSKSQALQDLRVVLDVLRRAGFVENSSKRQAPAQRQTFLGLEIDSISQVIRVPDEKLTKLLTELADATAIKRGSARSLARLAGKVISCLLATGPSPILLSRDIFSMILSAKHYDIVLPWRHLWPVFKELISELKLRNGLAIARPDAVRVSARQSSSDASATGLAICQILCAQGKDHVQHEGPCGRQWFRRELSVEEKALSSTHRELLAILDLLVHKGSEIAFSTLTHWTDNHNAALIVAKGSSKPDLQKLALWIHRLAQHFRVNLQVLWARRTDPRIKIADQFSRFDPIDIDDFGLSMRDFQDIRMASGGLDFDLFATSSNARCPRFCSIRRDAAAEFRDAFSCPSWKSLGRVYIHCSPHLVAPAIRKLVADRAVGVMIIPRWYTLKGWHLVCADGCHANNWVKRVKKFFPSYKSGPGVTSPTFKGKPRFPSLALWFDGTFSEPFVSHVSPLFCVREQCVKCK